MLPIIDVQTARETILKRIPPNEQPVPQSVLKAIENLFGEPLRPDEAVARILESVRRDGDQALLHWTRLLDGTELAGLRVEPDVLDLAFNGMGVQIKNDYQLMATRIKTFHAKQPLTSWVTNELGGTLGQLVRPIRRVGLYIPGGTAPLPSSVFMSAIPARVAGVAEIVVVTPPQRGTNLPHPSILAACAACGVDEVYTLGGAQAIAALAYGTESIKAVDKIFGPGNLFVTLAKQQVFGVVGIDGLAGPTETMVIADETARPAWVAADLLAQAEHDLLASAILLTPSRQLAEAVQNEVARQIETLSRADIAAASLSSRGGAVVTPDIETAVQLANTYGAEHLCLTVSDPWRLSEKITSAGGIFLGEHSFEVLGDYIAGPSHVMPTSGTARFASPLNVWDFIRIISLVALDQDTARQISEPAARIARLEQLDAHARASEIRLESTGDAR
jgi:histidinol dehydrogenase